jgi:prepilin-type N-terminal cleavage/methylation domain-containing protein
MTYNKRTEGFTLVELAIVIVIIGFLVAGIAVGANMIKQAELRSLITDFQQYQVAYNNFIGRYNKVPGDMDTASSYWSTAGVCGVAAVDCNGDGDGLIEHGTTIATNEVLKAWKQLSLANMISAGIAVLPATNTGVITLGTQAPISKKAGSGFYMAQGGDNHGGTGVNSPFATSTNAVFLGRGGVAAAAPVNPALTAEEAFNIDLKLDDGLVNAGAFNGASTGVFRAHDGQGVTAGNCATGTAYLISNTNSNCVVGLALN